MTNLAKPGDPYVLPGGVLVQEDTFGGELVLQEHTSAGDFRAKARRAINTLPDKPEVLNIIAAVLLYTLLGLTDREIGHIINIETEQIGAIRSSPAYIECFDAITKELINANSDHLQSKLAAQAANALNTIIDLSMNGKEQTRLRASSDLLDRAGIKPQDANRSNQNELRIVIMKDEQAATLELNGEIIDAVRED